MKNLQPPLPSFISIYIVLYFISCASDPTVNPRQLPQQNDLGVEVECRVDQDCSPQEECNRQGVCVTNIGVDVDRDGVPDAIDNCPHLSNSGQEDCDQNGVGDACDPAGSCGSQLSLSTFRLDQNNNRYPLPCTYVEFENSNFRAQTNVIGSVNLYIPRSLPKQYLKLYSGLVQGNDLEKRCVPATKIMKSAFEQVPLSTYVLDREQLLAINPNQNLSLQVTARGFGKIKGQVLLADRSAHQSQHGGIRVYVKGYEKTSTLSDPYGHFTLNHVPADQNHTLVFAYDGYTILELTQQRVDNQHVLSIDAHVLDGGGDHLFECRDQLSTTTCITNETSNHTCQSCDQHTQCDEFELCIRSVLSNALVLYPANPGEEIDKDVRIKVQILTIPTHQEQYQIDPNPTLTIKTTYDGMITQVPLTYMASESTDQISIYRYNTRLKMGDVYQMLVEANDQTRIMVARKEGFSIEPSNSSEEIEEEFLLIPYRSQLDGTFDEDADSIIDQEDIDQDGDGCVDDWDRFPRNPFLCLDEDVLDLENFYE